MTQPRKVLYLNHVSRASGAENSLLATLAALNRGKFLPILACPSEGDLPRRAREMGIEVRELPMRRLHRTRNPLKLLRYAAHVAVVVRRLRQIVCDESISLIHANSTTAHIYGAIAGRLTGVPTVWHARDLAPLGLLGRGLFRLSGRVIAISSAVAESVAPEGERDLKVVTVHNGIDVEAFCRGVVPGKVRQELGLGKQDKLIVMAAQMVRWKGHEVFLRALSQVPDAAGLIVGEDRFGEHAGFAESLRSLCGSLKIADRVSFLGWREDVRDILADCDVVAIPSRAEPFGRVALEAMALAKPVVGTSAGGLPEIVKDGETGILAPPGDTDALAAALRSLTEAPKRAAAMGRAGRDRVDALFNIKDTARRIEQVYDGLLAARGKDANRD